MYFRVQSTQNKVQNIECSIESTGSPMQPSCALLVPAPDRKYLTFHSFLSWLPARPDLVGPPQKVINLVYCYIAGFQNKLKILKKVKRYKNVAYCVCHPLS